MVPGNKKSSKNDGEWGKNPRANLKIGHKVKSRQYEQQNKYQLKYPWVYTDT